MADTPTRIWIQFADPEKSHPNFIRKWATSPFEGGIEFAVTRHGWKPVPVEPTEAMLTAGHHQIDWCRNGQSTNVNEHPSQTEVIGGVTCGTTCKKDLQDAWAAMLAAAEREADHG